MNNLMAYGSSSDSEDSARITKKPKEKIVFRVDKIVVDDDYKSKVKPKVSNLKDFLPSAAHSIYYEDSYEGLLHGKKDPKPIETQELEIPTEEVTDFFTIPIEEDEKVEIDGPILPLKPEPVVRPFVFKPKQKLTQQEDISALVGREARNKTIEFKTITIQDQMGNKSIQEDRDFTIDTPTEDDPFKNLKGTFVPSSSSSRVNGIMKLAYDAKNSYKVSKARKEERTAVQKVVRAKYGF